jgi:hypothetical protein
LENSGIEIKCFKASRKLDQIEAKRFRLVQNFYIKKRNVLICP